MIYLVEGFKREGETITSYLKIGFTENLGTREYSYQSHGNFSGFIATREGTKEDEQLFQFYFRRYKSGFFNEWFDWSPEILEKFPTLTRKELDEEQFRCYQEFPFSSELTVQDFIKSHLSYFKEDTSRLLPEWRKPYLYLLEIDYFEFGGAEKESLLSALSILNGPGDFRDKMKFYCDLLDEGGHSEKFTETLDSHMVLPGIPRYYKRLGTAKLRSVGFIEASILKLYNDSRLDLSQDIYGLFEEGKSYTRKEIKEKLGVLYQEKGYNKTPKANDLEQYFDMKRDRLTINQKREEGFKIISKKV